MEKNKTGSPKDWTYVTSKMYSSKIDSQFCLFKSEKSSPECD